MGLTGFVGFRRVPASNRAMAQWRSETLPFFVTSRDVVGTCAASQEDRLRCFLVTRDGVVRGVDLETGQVFFSAQLTFRFPDDTHATLVASAEGRFLAVVQSNGLEGALFDVASGRLLKPLARDDYHADVSGWALAFVGDVLVTATAWNVIEAWSVPTLERLAPASVDGSLDYFYGALTVSPSGRWLASAGWFWHPVGGVRFIDVRRWLEGRADPAPEREGSVSVMSDWWDDDVCWVTDELVALRGCAQTEPDVYFGSIEGIALVDLTSKQPLRLIPGVPGSLSTDGTHVFSSAETTQAFSVESGALVAELAQRTHLWLPGARAFIALPQTEGPLSAHWLTGTHRALPLGLEAAPTRDALLVLADALEAHGGDPLAIAHCRAAPPHGRRCWVLESLR